MGWRSFVVELLVEYGIFLLKVVTSVIAVLFLFAGIFAIASKGKLREKGKLIISKMNKQYEKMALQMQRETLSKKTFKKIKKQHKNNSGDKKRKRIFVIKFHGDMRASAVEGLRQEITAILTCATEKDEVLLILESPGGLVHSYGLAASQIVRLREKNIPITCAIDKVAASGGYLMASVANNIIAAPFAIIGSIGVLAQMPNFHRYLDKHNIDFEQLSAGDHKRTLSLFGKNTDKAREKFQEELEEVHQIFKQHVSDYRPQLDIDKIATGEHWLASRAFELNLVDKLMTSDDYLQQACEKSDLYHVKFEHKKPFSEKISRSLSATINRCWSNWLQSNADYY